MCVHAKRVNAKRANRRGSLLAGAHVFVCTHGKRDARCGLCGPALVDAFRETIAALGMDDVVAVRGCSHTGGHKYAGNVLVFTPGGGVANQKGDRKRTGRGAGKGEGMTRPDADSPADAVKGVWYGYVTPLEVPSILERTVGKGEIIPRLWRGSMGVRPDEHEAMAAAEAARQGEEWPPRMSPCDACAEGEAGGGGGNVGDIEDVGGKVAAGIPYGEKDSAGTAGAAATSAAPNPPLWVDDVLKTSALVGVAGLVAAWLLGASTN